MSLVESSEYQCIGAKCLLLFRLGKRYHMRSFRFISVSRSGTGVISLLLIELSLASCNQYKAVLDVINGF